MDTMGHLLALHVTAAKTQDRSHGKACAERVHEVTGETVAIADID